MEKKNFLGMGILIVALILFSSMSSYSEEVRGVTDKSVKIGVIGDLTGPISDIWIPCVEAIKCYFPRYVNENGGVHGRKINFIIEDDRCTIPMALSAFKKLIFKDRVLMLIGASGLGHTHAVIPLAEKDKMPMMAVTNDNRYFQPVRKYVFGTIPHYEDQLELIFEYIFKDLEAKNPTIALAYPDLATGKTSRDTCRKLTKVYDIKEYMETIIFMGAGDFTTQILRLKRQNPDYVIIHGYTGSTSAFLRDAYKFKFKSTFIGIQYATDDDMVKLAGVAASGFIGTNAYPQWNDDSPGMAQVRKIVLKCYPETRWKSTHFLNGWVISKLIHNALVNAGRGLTPETVVQGYEKIRNLDTICGIVSFGPDDHKPIDYSRFYKADVEKKQLVPITDWRKPPEKE